MDHQEDKEEPGIYKWVTWIALGLPAFIAGVAIWKYTGVFGVTPSSEQETWGQFGDFWGGLMNPIVGLITIALLILTLTTQRRELADQRKELALQRKESQRSADALDAQHTAIQIQSFEQTLFKWFDNYRELVQSVEFSYVSTPSDGGVPERVLLSGQKALRRMTTNLYKIPPDLRAKIDIKDFDTIAALEQSEIDGAYDDIKRNATKSLDNEHVTATTALRTLYGIFKWISSNDDSCLQARKEMYAKIIRAQLSEYELRLLFINGIRNRGRKFVQYANEYAIFDNMHAANSPIINILLLATECPYTDRAFGGQKPRAFKEKQARREQANRIIDAVLAAPIKTL